MKCPSCKKTAVSLWLWLVKYSWARWDCSYCHIKLKANATTWICILSALIYVLASFFLPYLFNVERVIKWPKGAVSLVLLTPLIPLAFFSYFFCGYKIADK